MKSIGEDITKKLIETGGIRPGMKVLDLGCGRGNVSFLLAKLVGEGGSVVGIDPDEKAILEARHRSKDLDLHNVQFYAGTISGASEIPYADFDAVFIRRVLMYIPNPVDTLSEAKRYLKPNGVLLVQENDNSLAPMGLQGMPLHEKISGLIKKTLERENIHGNMGFMLDKTLNDAGLKVEKIWGEAVVSTPTQPTSWGFLVKVMKNRMLRQQVIDNIAELDSLEEKLAQERANSDATFISELVFCGVARKPA